MQHAIDAIYENGMFRPVPGEQLSITEGRRVRITVEEEPEPSALQLALQVYDGLSETEIAEIEEIALDRSTFFSQRNPD
jgi:predicted DNA-binding antitoxin AbrB/MazE fold protein